MNQLGTDERAGVVACLIEGNSIRDQFTAKYCRYR